LRNNTVAIGDQNRLAGGGEPNILTQLILERFEANGAHGLNVATRGPFVKTVSFDSSRIIFSFPRFSAHRLSKPHAGSATVLVDELDARHLQSLSYFFVCFTASAERAITCFQPLYCWN